MLQFARVFTSFLVLLIAVGSHAQAPYPPPALLAAQSVDAAVAAVGGGRVELSGYLLIDIPEISLAGDVKAVVKSELPGTTQLVLLRQFPVAPAASPNPQQGRDKAAPARPAKAPATLASLPSRPTVLIAAKQIEPGQAAEMVASFDFQRNEKFTLLAFAQGRWFGTAREIKLATAPSDRP